MKKLICLILLILILVSCQNKQTSLNIHVISDVHYAPSSLFSYTGAFKDNNDSSGTFKQVEYLSEIIDAYIDEEIKNKPDYILVTGDLVYSGSYDAHKEFTYKFNKLLENNIKVLVLPGNHDFDSSPYSYTGTSILLTNQIDRNDFISIYKNYGYNEAKSIDENSLSYSYILDDNHFLVMLDTLQEYGYTAGQLKDETLDWLENELKYAKSKNMNIIVAGHHNIFLHNNLFDYGYRLNNSKDLISLLNKYNVSLYLSGHLHIQSIKEQSNITEILNEAFTIYPHTYGQLIIDGNDIKYEANQVDVENYYKDSDNEFLSNYQSLGYEFILNNSINQVYDRLSDIEDENDHKFLANIYGKLNINYFIGTSTSLSQEELDLIQKYNENKSDYYEMLIKYKDNNLRFLKIKNSS